MLSASDIAKIERALDAFCADASAKARTPKRAPYDRGSDKSAALLRRSALEELKAMDIGAELRRPLSTYSGIIEFVTEQEEVPYQEIERLTRSMAFELE